MGRIKTKLIKSLTNEVYQKYQDRFTTDFGKNKEVIKAVERGASPKIRNIISGYATRMKKKDLKDQI